MQHLVKMTIGNGLISKIYEFYAFAMETGDRRTKDWFLVASAAPMISIIFGYLGLVYFGPKLMVNKKPLQLRKPLVIYNFCLVFLNAYFVYTSASTYLRKNYNWVCQYIDSESSDPDDMKLAEIIWCYYISKLIDFLDTVFFILRKKNDQLTFLHVYHHASVIALLYVLTKWTPGGVGVVILIVNSFVHAIMYTYYGLAAVGPSVYKYLWWKKYITIIQLMQFLIIISIAVNGIVQGDACRYPTWLKYVLLTYITTFLFLFAHFYVLAYWKGKRLHPITDEEPVLLKKQTNGYHNNHVNHHNNHSSSSNNHNHVGNNHSGGDVMLRLKQH